MYAFIWRHLPGPWAVRALLCLALLVLALFASVTWLFPWIATLLPLNDATIATP